MGPAAIPLSKQVGKWHCRVECERQGDRRDFFIGKRGF